MGERRGKKRTGEWDAVGKELNEFRSITPACCTEKLGSIISCVCSFSLQIADSLQKKMRNRPGRDNLLQMNILPGS